MHMRFGLFISAAALLAVGLGASPAQALQCNFETPSNGNLGLGDDTFANVSGLLPAGAAFTFFGVDYGPGQPGGGIFVGSNGYVTFGAGDTDLSESLEEYAADPPRIAALWDDLNPSQGGAVKAEFLTGPSRLVVTWDGVPEFFASGSNTFQVTLFDSGRYEIVYNGISATDGSVGVTPGTLSETDLSASRVTTANEKGFIAERFSGGADSFDLDGRCLEGSPVKSASANATLRLR